MKNETLSIILVIICFICSHKGMSQNSPAKWQEQIESIKGNVFNEGFGDLNHLSLMRYTYKGVIKSETEKLEIVNMLFSEDAPTILNYPPMLTKDTITAGDSCLIEEKSIPVFKIISISEMRKIVKSADIEDPIIKVKEKLNEIIKIGYEYIELEWKYDDKKIKSICIVSNEAGGIIYDNIGFNIITTKSSKCWKVVNSNKME